ncbi:vacuolar protein sorting-associated protein 13B-like [Sinocyclocheilus rhinocerous]|uniref:vacuolar protein sorting-associated protein 13B-like n=1 Tax=Sinocyclocheilus rhinocerous TaxID=307959 RepID=UPI0007B7B3F0|nr:PREDICTED: vacuolar protein sorting-associated protein 13B-like [Sinocyclocheilus rhinocerous]
MTVLMEWSQLYRYIKNLKPSDLQLSLWGGDVVLSKLDLRLDVLEQELKLPFTFLSGHIHELRIHVPWTKLSSEPVVITINTMECILKLRDGATDDNESCTSSSTNRSASESSKAASKPRRVQQAPSDPDLPPGVIDYGSTNYTTSVRRTEQSQEGEGESGLYTDTQESGATRPLQNSPRDPIVSVGFYCTKASVTFKLTESCSESSYYSPQKLKSREVLSVEQEGITVELIY